MHLVQPSKVKKARKHDVVTTFDGQSSCATQVQSSLSHKATIQGTEHGLDQAQLCYPNWAKVCAQPAQRLDGPKT